MDSEEKMKDLLKEIELSILDYQNNVLQGKYADNLQKLQEKLDSLKKTFDEFLELQKTTKLSWKSNVQFRAAIQYFKILLSTFYRLDIFYICKHRFGAFAG